MAFHTQTSRPMPASAARGFTLIELMVGLVLGLLTTLVITQVMATAEGTKRTLTNGGDAQVNGALALYTLQQEMQMAGYGAVINPAALGCPIKGGFKDPDAAATVVATPFNPTLAPVVITNGTDGAPDTLTLLQSRLSGFSAPILVAGDHAKASNFFVVKSSFGANVGDLMVAVPGDGGWADGSTWCTAFDVTSDGAATPTDTTLSPKRIPHVTGGASKSKWNANAVFPDGGYSRGSYLLNMGTLLSNTYSIDAALNLVVVGRTSSSTTSTTEVLYPQIVNLQAMYGKDTTGNGQVDTYDTTTPTDAAGWQQVLAIRVAVVARSNQFEKDKVTLTAPLWDVGTGATIAGTSTCGSSKCIALKVSHVDQWERYRYRVYDTVIPLRNMLWNSAGGAS